MRSIWPCSVSRAIPILTHNSNENWTSLGQLKRKPEFPVAFELWCWRRLLRVPWTARISNQSILKVISPEYSLEGLMQGWDSNTLATWWKNWLIGKDPDPGKDWRWEEKGTTKDEISKGWITSLTQWTWVWVDSGSWWWTRRPGMLQSMGLQRVKHSWATSWRRRGRKQTIKKNVFYQISILGNTLKEKKAQNLQQLFASCNKLFKFLSLI